MEVTNTNDSVNGTKTAVQRSMSAKFVVGWEAVEAYSNIENPTTYAFSPRSIIYANNLFVVVGGFAASGGQIGWSNDGINWTVVANTTFGTSVINGIAYGNNRFIAVGDGGKMASSTDGKTWTSLNTSATFDTSNINDIAYGNNRFFAVADDGKSAHSTDNGLTWTREAPIVNNILFNGNRISRIVHGANRFVTYVPLSTNAQAPQYADIASDWQGQPIASYGWTGTATIMDLISAGSYVVAVGTGGNVWKTNSNTGIVGWTDISPSSVIGTELISKAAYGAGKLIVFSLNKGAWSADDGETWTELPYVNVSRMAYGAGRFVAVAGGSGIFYSNY